MKRIFSAKPLAAAAIVLGALGAATAAQARSDVYFSIGVQAPYSYYEPAPVYVQPRTVYVQPQPVYVQPQPEYAPAPVYYEQPRYADRRGFYGDDGVTVVYTREQRRQWRHAHRRGPWGDFDGDGVANRYDRFPADPYRR